MKRYPSLFIIPFTLLPLMLPAQLVRAYQSNSEVVAPVLEWYATGLSDTVLFEVRRSHPGSDDFRMINPMKLMRVQHDTVIFTACDTTLLEPGIYRYLIAVYHGVDTLISEIMFAHTPGYISPPGLVEFNASPVKGRKAIELSWQLNENRTVQSISLFRSRTYEDGYELVAVLSGEATRYVDDVERSNEPWFYFLLIRDFFGYQVPGTRIHGFSTFAEVPLPPQDMEAVWNGTGMRLKWRGIGDNIIGYNVYRMVDERSGFRRIASQYYAPGSWVEWMDTLAYPVGTSAIGYYSKAVSDGFMEGPSGDTVFVQLPVEVPVPPPVQIDYTLDAAGHALLLWPSLEGNTDVAGYNVFRGNPGSSQPMVKLNRELLPYTMNYFTDTTLVTAGEYRYEVESVALSGKPSELRTGVMVYHNVPEIILLLSSTQDKTGITLTWQPIAAAGITHIHIYRQRGEEQPVLLAKVPNNTGSYKDTKAIVGSSYIYTVYAEPKTGGKLLVNEGHLVVRN